jgi:ankyrin repeat protein
MFCAANASQDQHCEMFKLLQERGADFRGKDVYQFNTLLYATRSNSLILFFYLLALGADLHETDANASGVQHWASHNNNVFLLQFFDTLRMDLWIRDNQGFNPLERAVRNLSYDCIYYLAMHSAHEENLLTIASLELTNSNSVF